MTTNNEKRTKKEKYLVISSFFLALVSLGGIWSSISLFLPAIEELFKIDIVLASLLFVVMLLPVPFTELITLPLKKYGQNTVVFLGIILLGLAGAIHPFIPNYWLLLLFRFVAASGFGILFMYHSPIMAKYTSEDQKAVNTLLLISGLVTGALLSPFISIFIYPLFNYDWRLTVSSWSIFAMMALVLWLVYTNLASDINETKNEGLA